MEEAEAKTKRIEEATTQYLMEIQAERDAAIEQIHLESERKIQQIEKQAKEAMTQAQNATAEALEKARLATTRAHDADIDARTKIATADQLIVETRTTLERERGEVDRLRDQN